MSYPIRITDQLKPHLRALRKARGLTQAQLGMLIGVKQARIAEIESNPGAVSLDQLAKVLAALGATLHLHEAETRASAQATKSAVAPAAAPRTPVSPTPVARKSVPRTIPPKKGSW